MKKMSQKVKASSRSFWFPSDWTHASIHSMITKHCFYFKKKSSEQKYFFWPILSSEFVLQTIHIYGRQSDVAREIVAPQGYWYRVGYIFLGLPAHSTFPVWFGGLLLYISEIEKIILPCKHHQLNIMQYPSEQSPSLCFFSLTDGILNLPCKSSHFPSTFIIQYNLNWLEKPLCDHHRHLKPHVLVLLVKEEENPGLFGHSKEKVFAHWFLAGKPSCSVTFLRLLAFQWFCAWIHYSLSLQPPRL